MVSKALTAAALATAMWTAPAMAATLTFDTAPTLGQASAPGVWYTDRYAPAEFTSEYFEGDNRLKIGISSDDGAAGRGAQSGAFYNTQGRKYDTPNAVAVSVDMYIDEAWQGATGRIGGLWGTGIDGSGNIASYPIVEFFDDAFQVWDGLTGWNSVGTPGGFAFGDFVTLSITLDVVNNVFNYSVGGQQMASFSAYNTTSIENVILQAINTTDGIDRDLYFDNLQVSAVPVPAALPLFGTALAGLAFMRRRKAAKTA